MYHYHRDKYSVLFNAIAIGVVCLSLFNDIAFAFDNKTEVAASHLAPPVRINPDDICFVDLSLRIGNFLKDSYELSNAGLSLRGLRSLFTRKRTDLARLISEIKSKIPALDTARYDIDAMSFDGKRIVLPYNLKTKSGDKKNLLLQYSIREKAKDPRIHTILNIDDKFDVVLTTESVSDPMVQEEIIRVDDWRKLFDSFARFSPAVLIKIFPKTCENIDAIIDDLKRDEKISAQLAFYFLKQSLVVPYLKFCMFEMIKNTVQHAPLATRIITKTRLLPHKGLIFEFEDNNPEPVDVKGIFKRKTYSDGLISRGLFLRYLLEQMEESGFFKVRCESYDQGIFFSSRHPDGVRYKPQSTVKGTKFIIEISDNQIPAQPAPSPDPGNRGTGTNNSPAEDGYIRKGDISKREFESRLNIIKENNVTSDYIAGMIRVTDAVLKKVKLPGDKKAVLEAFLKRLKGGAIKIYGFNYIVSGSKDYFFAWNNILNNEVFVPTTLFDDLKSYCPYGTTAESLINELVCHEILCPILGHKLAIRCQQYLFSNNYPDIEKLKTQDPANPYKGILSDVIRKAINERCAESGSARLMADIFRAEISVEQVTKGGEAAAKERERKGRDHDITEESEKLLRFMAKQVGVGVKEESEEDRRAFRRMQDKMDYHGDFGADDAKEMQCHQAEAVRTERNRRIQNSLIPKLRPILEKVHDLRRLNRIAQGVLKYISKAVIGSEERERFNAWVRSIDQKRGDLVELKKQIIGILDELDENKHQFKPIEIEPETSGQVAGTPHIAHPETVINPEMLHKSRLAKDKWDAYKKRWRIIKVDQHTTNAVPNMGPAILRNEAMAIANDDSLKFSRTNFKNFKILDIVRMKGIGGAYSYHIIVGIFLQGNNLTCTLKPIDLREGQLEKLAVVKEGMVDKLEILRLKEHGEMQQPTPAVDVTTETAIDDIPKPGVGSEEPVDTLIVNIYDELKAAGSTYQAYIKAAWRIMDEVIPRWAHSDESAQNYKTACAILRKALAYRTELMGNASSSDYRLDIFMEEVIAIVERRKHDMNETKLKIELKEMLEARKALLEGAPAGPGIRTAKDKAIACLDHIRKISYLLRLSGKARTFFRNESDVDGNTFGNFVTHDLYSDLIGMEYNLEKEITPEIFMRIRELSNIIIAVQIIKK